MSRVREIKSIGILGFGAFGRFIARHLSHYRTVWVYDRSAKIDIPANMQSAIKVGDLSDIARCDLVIIAVPVSAMAVVIREISPLLLPGCIVVDVGSVKMKTAQIMKRGLPSHVEIIGTHPLFGPQSGKNGINGLKITLCPIRGRSHIALAAALRKLFGLKVYCATPEVHDREAAIVQGLTHLIAKVLVKMEPLPDRLTTKSFDLLVEAINMVRNDPPSVFNAIENDNPFAEAVRDEFFALAEQSRIELMDSR